MKLTDKEMVDAIQHLYQVRAVAEVAAKVSMDDFRAIEQAVTEKLGATRCAITPTRKPLTQEEQEELISNWFAEDWAQEKARGLLDDYATARGITGEPE